ncbi:MAG: hypothetical protein IPK07_29220 [Deltaproteobacteria bacterium]|nr:hypothetical protein [Deltaproteobacteria bacterium]
MKTLFWNQLTNAPPVLVPRFFGSPTELNTVILAGIFCPVAASRTSTDTTELHDAPIWVVASAETSSAAIVAPNRRAARLRIRAGRADVGEAEAGGQTWNGIRWSS